MPRIIDSDDVVALHEQGVPVVDVLPPESFERQHIPGAVNAPIDDEDFDQRIRQVAPDKDAPVVVYCLNRDCAASPAAAHLMEEHLGYRDVHLFEAGITGWRRAGHAAGGKGPRRIDLNRH